MAETEEFYRLLGRRVEEARRQKGLTQTTLGNKLIPPQTRASISNIEKGNQRVLTHTLVQLSIALGVEIPELIPKPSGASASQRNVADTLAEKLQVSKKDLRRLVRQLRQEERP